MISIDRLRKELSYDENTGLFYWNVRKQARKHGWFSGNKKTDGYGQIYFEGKHILVHHVAWMIKYGEKPPFIIDHINRDIKDNRIKNLRLVTPSQNT